MPRCSAIPRTYLAQSNGYEPAPDTATRVRTELNSRSGTSDGGLLALGRVPHLDAKGGELIAKRVGGGEVASGPGGGAALQQLVGPLRKRRLRLRRSLERE